MLQGPTDLDATRQGCSVAGGCVLELGDGRVRIGRQDECVDPDAHTPRRGGEAMHLHVSEASKPSTEADVGVA
eukprot:15480508-Alexandrium_andersonii.AAC.1